MKILFSPSEGKKEGGNNPPINNKSFLFENLYEKRKEVIKKYNHFLATSSHEQLKHLFGIKDAAKIDALKGDIFTRPTLKAINRYNGVAYDYLDYETLNQAAKDYIDNNTIIFSNLFGPVLSKDALPEYKLKQGLKIDEFAPEVFYKKYFSKSLDELLENEPLLDLRAGFYTKFYKPLVPHVTLKFLKNGKSVSHWAKAYRGIVLRIIALHNIQSTQEFCKLKIDNLQIEQIVKKNLHTEIIFNILQPSGK